MPNSYAVTPNIIPGNVSIGGDLTVGGDHLRIGAAAPFVRLGKAAAGTCVWKMNLQYDTNGLDDPTKQGQSLAFDANGIVSEWKRVNTGIGVAAGSLVTNLWTDTANHGNTGSVTENTILSKTINGNILRTNMAVLIRANLLLSVQGAGNATLRLRIGGVLAQQYAVSALNDYLMESYLQIQGAINSNRVMGRLTNMATGAVLGSTTQPNVDLSLDQIFSITLQSANVGDVQSIAMASMQLLSTFGPI